MQDHTTTAQRTTRDIHNGGIRVRNTCTTGHNTQTSRARVHKNTIARHGTKATTASAGILKDKALKTKSEDEGGAGHQGVYAQGNYEDEGDPDKTKATSLHQVHLAAISSKNRSGLIIEVRMVAKWKGLTYGGYIEEQVHVNESTVCSTGKEKRLCFRPEIAKITGLWLAGELTDIEDDSVTGL